AVLGEMIRYSSLEEKTASNLYEKIVDLLSKVNILLLL
ncbi:MAG: hypothetical protein ACJA16_005398, partial [Akkermansiaceae bacterium]